MISIRSCADMARVLASSRDVDLNSLLTERCGQLVDFDAAHFIVVEVGDTLAAIEGEGGVPLATNFADGSRLGEPDFTDNFEWIERHGDWFEAAIDFGDFAVVLLVPDRPEFDAALLSLVRGRP